MAKRFVQREFFKRPSPNSLHEGKQRNKIQGEPHPLFETVIAQSWFFYTKLVKMNTSIIKTFVQRTFLYFETTFP